MTIDNGTRFRFNSSLFVKKPLFQNIDSSENNKIISHRELRARRQWLKTVS